MCNKILNKLIDLCHTHTQKTAQRHAAIVYSSQNKILGSSLNTLRSRGYGTNLPSMHAEAGAIHQAYGSYLTSGVLRSWLQSSILRGSPKVAKG